MGNLLRLKNISAGILKYCLILLMLIVFLGLLIVGYTAWKQYGQYDQMANRMIAIKALNIDLNQQSKAFKHQEEQGAYDSAWSKQHAKTWTLLQDDIEKLLAFAVNHERYEDLLVKVNQFRFRLTQAVNSINQMAEAGLSHEVVSTIKSEHYRSELDHYLKNIKLLSLSLISETESSLSKMNDKMKTYARLLLGLLIVLCLSAFIVFRMMLSAQKSALPMPSKSVDEAEEKYRKIACYDSLTNLANRFLFQDVLQKAMARVKRTKEPLVLFYLDLDHFKRVNDTLGHEAGDLLLQLASKRLMSCVRDGDTVARLGGDEFAILLETVETAAGASEVAKRIIQSFKPPFVLYGHEVFSSPSIGIAIYPDAGGTIKELVQSADMAMYKAKKHGRNNYNFFTSELNEKAQRNLAIEEGLRVALQKGELRMFYQPQIDTKTNRVIGIEALIRWDSERLGKMFPDEFIPVAEETGVILPIGEWVMRETCKQFRSWCDLDAKVMKDIVLGINISVVQLEQQDVLKELLAVLSDTRIKADRVMLEVTETALMQNEEKSKKALNDLHANGFAIALDDFGTGYSSLSMLQQMPISQLKIDYSFTKNIVSDLGHAYLVRGLIQLSNSIGVDVMAEGVETQEELDVLVEMGCTHMQGFFYSKPLPGKEFFEFIKKYNA